MRTKYPLAVIAVASLSAFAAGQPVAQHAEQAPGVGVAPVPPAPALFSPAAGVQAWVPRPWMTPTVVVRLNDGVLRSAVPGATFTIEVEPGSDQAVVEAAAKEVPAVSKQLEGKFGYENERSVNPHFASFVDEIERKSCAIR